MPRALFLMRVRVTALPLMIQTMARGISPNATSGMAEMWKPNLVPAVNAVRNRAAAPAKLCMAALPIVTASRGVLGRVIV